MSQRANFSQVISVQFFKIVLLFAVFFGIACSRNAQAGEGNKVIAKEGQSTADYKIVLDLPIDSLVAVIAAGQNMALLSEVHGHATSIQLKRERLEMIRIEKFAKLIEDLHQNKIKHLSKDSASAQLSNVVSRNKKDLSALSATDLTLLEESVANLYYQLFVATTPFSKLEIGDFQKGLFAEWRGEELQNKDSLYTVYQQYRNQFNLSLGKSFLDMNRKRKGVFETASGLQYEVLSKSTKDGNPKPTATSKVTVHYHGILLDGTVFDSSFLRDETISFGLNQVIPGWTEGLQLMSNGDTFRFYIPYNLAYGERGNASIPGFSLLIFDVKLFDFK